MTDTLTRTKLAQNQQDGSRQLCCRVLAKIVLAVLSLTGQSRQWVHGVSTLEPSLHILLCRPACRHYSLLWPSTSATLTRHHISGDCLVAGPLYRLSGAGLMTCHQLSCTSLITTQDCSLICLQLPHSSGMSFPKCLICSNGDHMLYGQAR